MAAAKKKSVKPKKKPAAAKATARKIPAPKTKPSKSISMLKRLPRPSLMSQLAGSGAGSPKLPPRLQAVVDKHEIAELLSRFARGVDRIDETLLRSVFHPDATLDLGPGVFQGTSNDYVHWILGVLHQIRSSHHMISNVRAQLEGDVALVESYCHAYFRLDKPTGREDVFMGCRYLDRMEKRPAGPAGVWKIVHHKKIIDWVRTDAASDIFYHQNPDALWSYRTKTDPSYQMAQFPGSQTSGKLPAFLGRRYESKSIKF
ncbi:MAG: nuclear transport factor 2 family protein [Alphaproteobacteria bacterium]|nr:nuclear transport factor 2 family protein [Alphaproteobacteria bacterium]